MDAELRTHKDLEVWKQSIDLVSTVYRISKTFPHEERYGLANQMRRAAVSISSNIAEGAGRGSRKEFSQFLHIALGSLSEVETQIIIAKRLGYLDDSGDIEEQIQTVRKLILCLVRYLRARNGKEQ